MPPKGCFVPFGFKNVHVVHNTAMCSSRDPGVAWNGAYTTHSSSVMFSLPRKAPARALIPRGPILLAKRLQGKSERVIPTSDLWADHGGNVNLFHAANKLQITDHRTIRVH